MCFASLCEKLAGVFNFAIFVMAKNPKWFYSFAR